jgi:drug/metabolite transporter (DMT)-like permease
MGGLQSRRRRLLAVLVVSQAAGLSMMLAIVLIRGEGPPAAGPWIAWAMGGGLIGIVGLAAFYRGLATGSMGVVAPISSAAAVIPLVVGLAGGERPDALQAAGIATVLVGVVLAAREKDAAASSGARVAAGAGLALIAAVGFGSFFVALDRASNGHVDVLWIVVAARTASLTVLAATAALTRTPLPRRARELGAIAPVGLLDTSANVLFTFATTRGLLSLVAVLGSAYPVVTVVLAHVVLGERLHPLQRVGAAGALVGAALISAG